MSKECITITIIDNLQTENPEESFFVTLEKTEGTPLGVILDKTMAEIIIIDNNGKPSCIAAQFTGFE